MVNLFDVDQVRRQIEAQLREYPELADDEFLRADMLASETDMYEVLTTIHRGIEDSKSLLDGATARMDELKSRRARMQRRVDFGRALITSILMSADLKKVELPEVTLSLRNNPPQMLGEVTDAGALPDDLVKITRTADRVKIRQALELGREVPGFVLNNSPPSLMTRVK
jgi:hypothetical protein